MIYGFILFLMALQYIMNVLLGMLYAFIFYVIAVTFENQINNLIKHATIMNIVIIMINHNRIANDMCSIYHFT